VAAWRFSPRDLALDGVSKRRKAGYRMTLG